MKIYLITDTHLGHDKLTEYTYRPKNFSSIQLKELEKVGGDLLVHLGDICIGNDATWHKYLMYAARNFTKKILVRGNHDQKSDTWYVNHGWDAVYDSHVLSHAGLNMLCTHAPKYGEDTYHLNLHGHLHGSAIRRLQGIEDTHRETEEEKKYYNPRYHIDLAPELYQFKPVDLDDILMFYHHHEKSKPRT